MKAKATCSISHESQAQEKKGLKTPIDESDWRSCEIVWDRHVCLWVSSTFARIRTESHKHFTAIYPLVYLTDSWLVHRFAELPHPRRGKGLGGCNMAAAGGPTDGEADGRLWCRWSRAVVENGILKQNLIPHSIHVWYIYHMYLHLVVFLGNMGIHWMWPPPSNSGKWRFIGIPYWNCNNPGGHCYWEGATCKVYIPYMDQMGTILS